MDIILQRAYKVLSQCIAVGATNDTKVLDLLRRLESLHDTQTSKNILNVQIVRSSFKENLKIFRY